MVFDSNPINRKQWEIRLRRYLVMLFGELINSPSKATYFKVTKKLEKLTSLITYHGKPTVIELQLNFKLLKYKFSKYCVEDYIN